MSISLIVGLGNPGTRYVATRHNVGFWLVDQLADHAQTPFRQESKFQGEVCRIVLNNTPLWLLKPTTFMNRSGQSIGAMANFYNIMPEQILVVHDELDLACGNVKLKQGGGHGGHNGLRDTVAHLGSNKFSRLRIGIDHPREKGMNSPVADYVLKSPSKEDLEKINDVITASLAVMPQIIAGGNEFQKAMKTLHS